MKLQSDFAKGYDERRLRNKPHREHIYLTFVGRDEGFCSLTGLHRLCFEGRVHSYPFAMGTLIFNNFFMAMTNADHFQQMLDSLIRQAKYFLEESGTFYPFGSYVDPHQQIRPISFFSKEEYPEADEVLNQLEAAVLKSLKDGQYLTAIIGVDVSVDMTTDDSGEKIPALQVRSYDVHGNISIRYCLYALTDNGYEFSALIDL